MIVNTGKDPTARSSRVHGEIYRLENWKEIFVVYFQEGDLPGMYRRPPFYIPVRKKADMYRAYECWVLPLAPFVWLFYFSGAIGTLIWRDFFDWLNMIIDFINGPKSKT